MAKKRLKKNKRRAMHKRLLGTKKPMTEEQKAVRKKMRETQSVADKARIAKTSKVVKVE